MRPSFDNQGRFAARSSVLERAIAQRPIRRIESDHRNGWSHTIKLHRRYSHRELLAGAAAVSLGCSGRSAGEPEFDLLLRGGHVIDPKNGLSALRDIAVRGGKVVSVEDAIDAGRAFKAVDCRGLYVTPGLVDLHVHLFAGTNEVRSYAGDNKASTRTVTRFALVSRPLSMPVARDGGTSRPFETR
ncbi:MAG: hypothetical protein OXH83_00150 [Bryobacterales bacterium]|nr:hypothetical protein [Bryobacterales bacterium]